MPSKKKELKNKEVGRGGREQCAREMTSQQPSPPTVAEGSATAAPLSSSHVMKNRMNNSSGYPKNGFYHRQSLHQHYPDRINHKTHTRTEPRRPRSTRMKPITTLGHGVMSHVTGDGLRSIQTKNRLSSAGEVDRNSGSSSNSGSSGNSTESNERSREFAGGGRDERMERGRHGEGENNSSTSRLSPLSGDDGCKSITFIWHY